MRSVCRTLVHAVAVHRIGLAIVLTLLTLTSCRSDEVATAECRQQFADHQQMLGENGNPGSKEFTPGLTARWDALYAEFGALGKSATADECPEELTTLKRRMKRVESVLYKIDDYDVARMIRAAEGDLDDAVETNGPAARRDYVLQSLFRTLRESGADAQKSLAPFVEDADAVDPDDYSALSKAMVDLYNAAASNAAFADFKEALETIEDYELHEE
jgi:hypothetical protein